MLPPTADRAGPRSSCHLLPPSNSFIEVRTNNLTAAQGSSKVLLSLTAHEKTAISVLLLGSLLLRGHCVCRMAWFCTGNMHIFEIACIWMLFGAQF